MDESQSRDASWADIVQGSQFKKKRSVETVNNRWVADGGFFVRSTGFPLFSKKNCFGATRVWFLGHTEVFQVFIMDFFGAFSQAARRGARRV